ncbi:MAG: NUDIX domain-containing protein, partial [Pseudomonadota bacterium]
MPPEPFVAGPGIDRADALRNRPEQIAELLIAPDARALVWDSAVPALEDGELRWGPVNGNEPLFLGLDQGRPRFSSIPAATTGPQARALLAVLSTRDAPLFAAALSLANWHLRHGFCSVCGNQNAIFRGGWARRCDQCGGEHYPRVDPVVIMLATFEDRLLLGRQPIYPPGRYSALAGFVEPGETIEAAVAREL